MRLEDIEKAAKLKKELDDLKGSMYNVKRLIDANKQHEQQHELSTCDRNIFGKIRLWFEHKNGKNSIFCGQPSMGNLSPGCNEKFEINAEQLEVFYEFLEAHIVGEKKSELLKLLNAEEMEV